MKNTGIDDIIIKYEILRHLWNIEFVDSADDKLNSKLTGATCYGLCDTKCRTIYVANNMKESVVEDTLLHELTHAYIGATLHHEEDDDFEEEFICEFFANFGTLIVDDFAAILKLRALQGEKQ